MPIIARKPTTDGQRGMTVVDFSSLSKTKPAKSLTKRLFKHGGRNNTGRVTVAGRGGGSKRLYRDISFKRPESAVLNIKSIEYDPNRTANIALVEDENKKLSYILASTKMKVGQKINSGAESLKEGSFIQLKNLPTATMIHNIELQPGRGGQICRAAGAFATLLGFDDKYAIIKLPSGETRKIVKECSATVGIVGNIDQNKVNVGKAGRTRHIGRRPTVRGKAKNPVDHPQGGGEGNTSIGLSHPKTPWGLPALGYKTRKRDKASNKYIVKSRAKSK